MKNRLILGLTLACSLAAASAPVRANFVFSFDEYGVGYINVNKTGGVLLMGALMADPTISGQMSLTFLLPTAETINTGDVRIFDDRIGGTLGDVLRFTDAAGTLNGALLKGGIAPREVAQNLGVSIPTLYRWVPAASL